MIFCSLFFSFLGTSVRAENLFVNSKISFSINTGINQGKITEAVFYSTSNERKTVSQLEWNLKGAPFIGFDVLFSPSTLFFIQATSNFSIPGDFGKIEDFDWMNIYSSGEENLTHYSINKNHIDYFYNGMVNIGNQWKIGNGFSILDFLSFSYQCFSFSGWDGYKQYTIGVDSENNNTVYDQWSESIEKINIYGKALSYYGNIFSLGLGLKLNFSFLDRHTVSLSGIIQPSFVTNLFDNHCKRDLLIGYTFRGLINHYFEISEKFHINKHHSVGISGKIFFTPEKEGEMYQKSTKNLQEKWQQTANTGGFKQILWNVGLNYIFFL